MYILTADEIKKVEQNCFANYYNEEELMLFAGTKCFETIILYYGEKIKKSSVSVLCGNGKNAGDGFVIAKLMWNSGINAKIIICDKMPELREPLKYYNEALASGVPVEKFSDTCLNVDYIVDSMFGIGFKGEARTPFDEIFTLVNQSSAKVIAIDTPSGTNSTDGSVCKNCVYADYTVAISTLKYAHILPPANAYSGKIDVVDIGIPSNCYNNNYIKTIDKELVKSVFPKINKNANKGTLGHQLNVCGSYKMFGAGVICAKSAQKTGVGLVKCAMPESAYPLMASHLVQSVFSPLPENEEKTISQSALPQILDDMKWADSVVVGCGLGNNEDTKYLMPSIIKNVNCPIIIDADGINSLIQGIYILKDIKVPVVLTPHPGEMSRLISKPISYVQENRIACAKTFAKEYGVVLVLKGANTVVTDGEEVFVNMGGNPGMAMGGTGDMLSGMIGSFVAQGVPPFKAAIAAVYIHSLCGDIIAEKISQRGMTVFDMIDQLGALMSEFE